MDHGMMLSDRNYWIWRRTMRIHFIQHDSWVKPGEYLTWAERHEYETSFTRCWQYDAIPETIEADMLAKEQCFDTMHHF